MTETGVWHLWFGDSAAAKTLGATYLGDNYVDGVPGTGAFYQGNIVDTSPANKVDFGAPDGLWFDQCGRLWIQTDQPADATGHTPPCWLLPTRTVV